MDTTHNKLAKRKYLSCLLLAENDTKSKHGKKVWSDHFLLYQSVALQSHWKKNWDNFDKICVHCTFSSHLANRSLDIIKRRMILSSKDTEKKLVCIVFYLRITIERNVHAIYVGYASKMPSGMENYMKKIRWTKYRTGLRNEVNFSLHSFACCSTECTKPPMFVFQSKLKVSLQILPS